MDIAGNSNWLLPLLLVIGVVLVVGLVFAFFSGRRHGPPPGAGPAAGQNPSAATRPTGMTEQVVDEIAGHLRAGKKIQAIKRLREATGLGLAEAKDRVDHWNESAERAAARAGSQGGLAHLAIEAGAVLRASGWDTAMGYLREQHGMSEDTARELLNGLGR